MKKRFLGKGLPNIDIRGLGGALIAIEGGDSAGCSTQATLLRDTLERMGYPTALIGIGRSEFMGTELAEALKTNLPRPVTLSLLHATELADQIEKKLISSLRAGFVVIADRYVFSVMAKDRARGGDPKWMHAVFGCALVPDIIFYLECKPEVQAERSFAKKGVLDFWESGRDMPHSPDLYEAFLDFQLRVQKSFRSLAREHGFITLNSARPPEIVNQEAIRKVLSTLPRKSGAPSKKQSTR